MSSRRQARKEAKRRRKRAREMQGYPSSDDTRAKAARFILSTRAPETLLDEVLEIEQDLKALQRERNRK